MSVDTWFVTSNASFDHWIHISYLPGFYTVKLLFFFFYFPYFMLCKQSIRSSSHSKGGKLIIAFFLWVSTHIIWNTSLRKWAPSSLFMYYLHKYKNIDIFSYFGVFISLNHYFHGIYKVTLVNKVIEVSGIQFYSTSSVYCIVYSVKSSIIIYLTPLILYGLSPHPVPLVTTLLLSVSMSFYLLVFLVCSFAVFSFISHIWEKSYGFDILLELFHLAWYSQMSYI